MVIHLRANFILSGLILTSLVVGVLSAAEDAGDELVQMIISLISDKDRDMRTVGLQQVREEAKGPAATRRFAALLPKLPAESQAGLLDALGDRVAARNECRWLQAAGEAALAAQSPACRRLLAAR